MTDKKMTRDEAEKQIEICRPYFLGKIVIQENKNEFIIFRDRTAIAEFKFEPPHPEKGTTCKFWNGDEKAFVIAPLAGIDLDDEPRYRVTNVGWFNHAEPYTLIDPAEHAELKKQNGKLHMEAADMRGQLKATTEDIQPLRVERDRLRREVRRLQGEIIDPEEHAKAKQTEAVLDELLPLCREVIEQHSRTVWPMSEPIERLEKLLK